MTSKMRTGLVVSLAALAALSLALAASGPLRAQDQGRPLRIAYVTWSSSTASSNMVKAVLQEKLGYRVDLTPMSADDMWRSVAEGNADVMLSAWLPGTHAHYLDRFGRTMVDLGPNLEGARTGLVVPDISSQRQTAESGLDTESYIKADSIPDLRRYAGRFGGRIIGIDPAAGIMKQTREAIDAYGLDYELVAGSEAAMTDALADAIAKRRWVVITGWTPHWMFARWRLKFLEDPKGVYGEAESIHTMVREGLEDDVPAEVYAFLDRFHWSPEEMGQVLIWNQMEGAYPYDTARRWMDTHPERVRSWLQ